LACVLDKIVTAGEAVLPVDACAIESDDIFTPVNSAATPAIAATLAAIVDTVMTVPALAVGYPINTIELAKLVALNAGGDNCTHAVFVEVTFTPAGPTTESSRKFPLTGVEPSVIVKLAAVAAPVSPLAVCTGVAESPPKQVNGTKNKTPIKDLI
jgi:hypothetical protein